MQMECFLGNPDNLRMMLSGTHTPLQLDFGRWKKALCLKITGNNEVTTDRRLTMLDGFHACTQGT